MENELEIYKMRERAPQEIYGTPWDQYHLENQYFIYDKIRDTTMKGVSSLEALSHSRILLRVQESRYEWARGTSYQ